MAIAGALVIPVNRDDEKNLVVKLNLLPGVEVQKSGLRGIAVVLEAEDTETIKDISKQIEQWREVIGFELAYLNWEELSKGND